MNELVIPESPINNFALGSIIQNIIDLRYPKKQQPKPSSDVPNYLPLRLLSIGYPFSGKKSLCAFLKQKYGIEILKLDDIIKEAVELVY